MQTITFTANDNIAGGAEYVLTKDEAEFTLYAVDADGDREHLDNASGDANILLVADTLKAAMRSGDYPATYDLYTAIQYT